MKPSRYATPSTGSSSSATHISPCGNGIDDSSSTAAWNNQSINQSINQWVHLLGAITIIFSPSTCRINRTTKTVLSPLAHCPRPVLMSRSLVGKLFQTIGATERKLRLPNVFDFVAGPMRWPWSAERIAWHARQPINQSINQSISSFIRPRYNKYSQ